MWASFTGHHYMIPAHRLLEGSGKFMRHVKLRPGMPINEDALTQLIEAAYSDIKVRVENG